MHIDPSNPPRGVKVFTDITTGGQAVHGRLALVSFRAGDELFLGSTWASRELLEDAYGRPDSLASLIASNVEGEIRRDVVKRIRELRGQD